MHRTTTWRRKNRGPLAPIQEKRANAISAAKTDRIVRDAVMLKKCSTLISRKASSLAENPKKQDLAILKFLEKSSLPAPMLAVACSDLCGEVRERRTTKIKNRETKPITYFSVSVKKRCPTKLFPKLTRPAVSYWRNHADFTKARDTVKQALIYSRPGDKGGAIPDCQVDGILKIFAGGVVPDNLDETKKILETAGAGLRGEILNENRYSKIVTGIKTAKPEDLFKKSLQMMGL